MLTCFVVGRLISMLFNYAYVKRYAFHSQETDVIAFPKYLGLVFISGVMAYGMIRLLMQVFGMHPLPAKLISEVMMYVVNFLVQRDLIF